MQNVFHVPGMAPKNKVWAQIVPNGAWRPGAPGAPVLPFIDPFPAQLQH
jgi:hypothetical protein